MRPISGHDPAARARYIEAYGPAAYERAMAAFRARTTVDIVNGYSIRVVQSERFGRIYMVDGLDRAAATLDGARRIAREAKQEGTK